MVTRELNLEGEANLDDKIFGDDSIEVVIREAISRGLTFDRLRIDQVTKDGSWKSTKESTIPSAVLYLKDEKGSDYLIVQRSKDEKYGLFSYKFTP